MAAPVKQLSDGNPGGTGLGQSATDLISFYGGTPVVQRASAAVSASLSLRINAASSVAAFGTAQWSAMWDALAEVLATLAGNQLHKGGA